MKEAEADCGSEYSFQRILLWQHKMESYRLKVQFEYALSTFMDLQSGSYPYTLILQLKALR